MARRSGHKGAVTHGGDTILGVTQWEVSQDGDAIDVTGMDSTADNREFIRGLAGSTVSISGYYDESASGQYDYADVEGAAVTVLLQADPSEDSGAIELTGSVFVTNLTTRSSADGLVEIDMEGTFTGAVTDQVTT